MGLPASALIVFEVPKTPHIRRSRTRGIGHLENVSTIDNGTFKALTMSDNEFHLSQPPAISLIAPPPRHHAAIATILDSPADRPTSKPYSSPLPVAGVPDVREPIRESESSPSLVSEAHSSEVVLNRPGDAVALCCNAHGLLLLRGADERALRGRLPL